jgi:hypothetical protein
MYVEILMKNGFQNPFLTGFEIDGAENPELRLVADSEPAFVLVSFNDKVAPADSNHIASLNPHEVRGVSDDLRPLDNWPIGQFANAYFKLILIVHSTLSRA